MELDAAADSGSAQKRRSSEDSPRSSRSRERRTDAPKKVKPNVTPGQRNSPSSGTALCAMHVQPNPTPIHQGEQSVLQSAEALQIVDDGCHGPPALVDLLTPATGFRQVPHRADRKQGIPIVVRVTPGGDLRKTNPKLLYNDILKAAGETPTHLKLANTGAITIDVPSEAAASRLLATTSVGGVQVEAQLPAAYRANTASIDCKFAIQISPVMLNLLSCCLITTYF